MQKIESNVQGSFEIKDARNGNLIWSTLVFRQFPDPDAIIDRIICYFFDEMTRGDIN